MALLFNITFVTVDVERLARFWQSAIGASVIERREGFVRLRSTTAGSPDLLLLHSDAPSRSAGRIHLDLAAEVVDDEVRRLVGLGATIPDGGWHSKGSARATDSDAAADFVSAGG